MECFFRSFHMWRNQTTAIPPPDHVYVKCHQSELKPLLVWVREQQDKIVMSDKTEEMMKGQRVFGRVKVLRRRSSLSTMRPTGQVGILDPALSFGIYPTSEA